MKLSSEKTKGAAAMDAKILNDRAYEFIEARPYHSGQTLPTHFLQLECKIEVRSRPMKEFGTFEKFALIAAVFFLAVGAGLLYDGKRLFQEQLKTSERVDFKRTLNPYL